MDAANDPTISEIDFMSSSQVGKTEALLNIIGYFIAYDPAPILVIMPTVEMGHAFSKDRLAPMIRDTPSLRDKVKDPRSRDSGNTILHKTFPGGHITIAGANAPAGLASRPIRIVLADEVDRYPASAGTEGDPVGLAAKRAATFWNRLIVRTSTPTIKGESRIEAAYQNSDRRRFYVPCSDCGHRQILRWQQVHWDDGEPASAVYVCEACGSVWNDATRWSAIGRGEWEAASETRGVAGFHLNAIASPWTRLGDLAREFVDAKRLPETLKVFINTGLGETWEESGETVEADSLEGRVESYDAENIPAGVLVITAGVDVQDDRVEMEVIGHGEGEETWSIEYKVIYGDPARAELWRDLDEELSETYDHPNGQTLRIAAACIDSGGHFTQQVYKFCRGKAKRRIFAVKGMAGEGRPVIGRPTRNNTYRVPLHPVGTDAAKSLIMARLQIETPGPGYCHFPVGYDKAYFDGLTAEVRVTKYHKGRRRSEWQKRTGRIRNEPLDCRVYGLAAFYVLNPRLDRIAKKRRRAAKPNPDAPDPPAPESAPETADGEPDGETPPPKKKKRVRRRRSGWLSATRGRR